METAVVTEDHVREELKRLIAEVTECEPEEVSDTAELEEELGIDSLMALEVMVAVDKKYKIDIPEEEFAVLKNVNEAVAAVMRYMNGSVAAA